MIRRTVRFASADSVLSTIGKTAHQPGESGVEMPSRLPSWPNVNVVRAPVEVPRLRFAVRNDAGHEVSAWTASPMQAILPSGNRLAFRTPLASPPADGRDVIVRILNRRDGGPHAIARRNGALATTPQ